MRAASRLARILLSLLVWATARPAHAQRAQPAPSGEPRVRIGTAVTPDTVTVGDPFVVTVRIQAPPGAQVTFPAAPDSGAGVELLDPRRDRAVADSGEVTATYRLAAWDVGTLPLRLGDVVVRVDGAERRVPLATLGVHVRSVLPADSALRVPKPAREPIADAGLWWLRWLLLALALLALIALLVWLARRWWRRRRLAGTPDAAHAAALAAFDRLDRMNLVAAGEPGRHVALAVEILRDYLAARLPEATPSRTSSELLAALAARADVPHGRLAALLETADLVKFAAWPIAPAPATEAGREARGLVDDVERALREREAREREEAAARERTEREARRRYEEEQRRRAARGGDGTRDRAA